MSDRITNVVPTRMELQNMKGKLKAASRGYDLLKKKSDALSMRFRKLIREIRDVKLKIGDLARNAFFSYSEVKFIASDISLTVLQSVGNMPQLLYMHIDNIAGVRVPEFTRVNSKSESSSLVGLSRGGQQISKAREAFSELMDAMIHLAELQSSFAIIDETLRITNRRVNAMEYVLIPRYKNTIAFVDLSLEESEHEEFFRLKKVQETRKRIAILVEAQRLARFNKPKEGQEGEPAGKAVAEKPKSILDESTDDSDLLF